MLKLMMETVDLLETGSLQNNYHFAIRNNKSDLQGMVKAVQASLLHITSSLVMILAQQGSHHGVSFSNSKNKKAPIPEAIVITKVASI